MQHKELHGISYSSWAAHAWAPTLLPASSKSDLKRNTEPNRPKPSANVAHKKAPPSQSEPKESLQDRNSTQPDTLPTLR
jgi:hypothetical protein